MLPCPRCDEHLYPVPKFDLGRDDIADFIHELRGFHEQFAECFQRSESREHFFNYMAGQFSELERKSIEPIALALKDGNVRALQRFVSDAPWDDDKIMSKYRSLVNDDLGSPDGALIFDESGFVVLRISSGLGLTRAALYKFFPNREAMLEAALDLLVERVPRWIARSPGDTVFEHLMGMGSQFGPLGLSVFESFTRPWFQFAAASGTGKVTQELAKRQLMFVRDFAVLVEQGKRDGSIREDADTNLIAWSLMMWAWAADVARLVGLEQVMGSETSVEIFTRMLGDIAGSSGSDEAASRDERGDAEDMMEMGHYPTRRAGWAFRANHDLTGVVLSPFSSDRYSSSGGAPTSMQNRTQRQSRYTTRWLPVQSSSITLLDPSKRCFGT